MKRLTVAQNMYIDVEHVVDTTYQVMNVHRVVGVNVGDLVYSTTRGWVVTRVGQAGPVTVLPVRTKESDSNWKYITNQREEE